MSYCDPEREIAYNTGRQVDELKDIALSLKILSGRKTLKELHLEEKLKDLNQELSRVSLPYPKMAPEQQEVLKKIDEVREEIGKERAKNERIKV